MNYLLYNTKEEAINRSEQAGIDMNLAYHQGDLMGSRYGGGYVFKTTTGKYAWPVHDCTLTSAEDLAKVTNVEMDITEEGYEEINY